ncbi:NAD(P)/FAD-dependent oxidoreductase [Candidatus Atribacteria bacterium MT.SAG.1]|nr:NAD(P)/FAD-dependent oxidoreductase [Candidatus Atribacteria bacterium MT.SAG.1]
MKYDVAVIGGGPAGMIAAGRAGELGSHVVLVEKNKDLGVKLLISGKGRCNITNKTDGLKEIVNRFGKNGKFLFSVFSKFGVDETINFFEGKGLKTKIERGGRVFPVSDKSQDVLSVLIKYLEKSDVEIKTNAKVRKIIKKGNRIEKIILANRKEIVADNFIICTGGRSYPVTGSTGDGYRWAENVGHTIIKPLPSLVPIIIEESYIKKLEGLSLKNVEISIYKNDKKINSRFGEAIFTGNGMSGPIILNMSKEIGKELPGKIRMQIDFKPALDFVKLDKRIQRDFQKNPNKLFRNSLDELLPQKLIPVIIKLSKIDPSKKVNSITKEERRKLLHLLKEFSLEIKELEGFKKAIITTGGIKLSQVEQKTMKSKLIDNLYFAGEIINVDGPTGGFNLQICWSTGYLAGENAARKSL